MDHNYPKNQVTTKTVSSRISRGKGLPDVKSPTYENVMPNVYLSVSSTLMERPNQICHLISCPAFLAALYIPFSSLLASQVAQIM
jgi:hypothetical protein